MIRFSLLVIAVLAGTASAQTTSAAERAAGWRLLFDGRTLTGWRGLGYDSVPTHVHPVGEWNQSRLVFKGNHGEHWRNGEKLLEFELGSGSMDSALAKSKYRSIPGFADRRKGHIVLQDHGDEVYFRNIKVRDL